MPKRWIHLKTDHNHRIFFTRHCGQDDGVGPIGSIAHIIASDWLGVCQTTINGGGAYRRNRITGYSLSNPNPMSPRIEP